MTAVTLKGLVGTPFRRLSFGDVCVVNGKLYVKTKPSTAREVDFNAVGIGHDDVMYFWNEIVQEVKTIEVEVERPA